MEVKIKKIEDKSQVEMEISVSAGDFEMFLQKAAKKLSKQTSIKGFRPGKAPVEKVAEVVGQERLLREAMDTALPHFFVQAALDNGVDAISRPNIAMKTLSMGKPLEFTATVDVLPEVKLGDPTKLEVEKRTVKVDDKRIEDEIKHVAKMRAKPIDVARPAQEGDTVTVDFAVKIDGKLIEGGESKNHLVTLGEGQFVPDFEKGITGIVPKDEREFSMKFPDDYAKKDLRGKEAQVSVKAHSVQKRILPKIDDEFAKGLGDFKDLTDLKKKMKENLRHDLEHKEQDRYFGEIAQKLTEISTFGHIPETLVDKEIDTRIEELGQMLSMQQKTVDDYLAQQKKTMEQVREGMREAASKNVKIGLTLRTFAEKQNIEATDTEIDEEATKQLAQYGNVEEAKKNVDTEALRDRVSAVIRNRKTLKKLAELAEK